ncbi:MAG: hypothetical protein QXP20_05160 [Candidatus Bathyarchaeia archaeon]
MYGRQAARINTQVWCWGMIVKIEGKKYELEYDPLDPFVAPSLVVAYCSQLTERNRNACV